MQTADGLGVAMPPVSSPAAKRLAAALDRISGALVRRAEADAAARDRREHAEAALGEDTLAELRDRLDAAIGKARHALGEG